MAASIELTGDVEKGPGYALLKVTPFIVDGPVRLSIMSNQGKTPYLTANGKWTSETGWIDLPDIQSNEDGSISVFLGPLLVDPIAMQPANVRFKATLVSGSEKAESLLRISRVLASAAGAPTTTPAPEPVQPPPPPPPSIPELEPEPEPAPEIKIEPEMRIEPEPRPLPPEPAKKSMALALIIGLVLVIGAAGLVGSWLAGLIPFGQQQTASSGAPSGFDGLEAVKAFLQKNPSAADARATAAKLQEENKADFALLIYQHAARQGDAASAKALAEMYDPDTWTKEKSPIPAADAETAAYWYEPAAKAGDVGAMRQLGKIMMKLSPTGSQNDKGLEWLKKAADAGDLDAKKLIEGK